MYSPSIPRGNSPLAILKNPERDIPAGERDIRVEDYLNDKIQTTADLKDLDTLISKIEEQKNVLQLQLQDVQTQLSEAKRATLAHSYTVKEQNEEFQAKYQSVQERLMIVTSSNIPEQSIERMKGPMDKLRKVELAQSYVDLLKDVGDLKRQARECLPADPKGALVPYTRLKELAILLTDLQEPTEGAAVHLVNHVQNTSNDLWTEMKKIMTDEFEEVLRKSKWPETDIITTGEWNDCFTKLLDLQGPELTDARQPVILLPMAVLSRTFKAQFRYHFFSDKPTNHPHQLGDYFFEWFIGTVAKWEDFFRTKVGPVLAAHFRGNIILAGNSLFIDPVAAFITALLPVLKEKVDSVLAQISDESQYLSRFILQLLNFDEKLRTQFRYDAGNPEHGWKGLTWDILDVWFDRWLKVEKDFAWNRYKEIIDNDETQLIDYESAIGKTKATFASLQVRDLMINVTQQYNKVRRFSQKMMFLIDIQAEILDDYIKSLKFTLDTYTQMTTLGRVAFSKEVLEKAKGVNGLDRLCRVYCSAEHLISLCKEWSNEEFFVDLWAELQTRAQHTDQSSNLAGDMTLAVVKDATSQAVGTEDLGSVFDETIEQLTKLRERAEELIVRQLAGLRLGIQVEANQFLDRALSGRVCKAIRRRVVAQRDEGGGEEEGVMISRRGTLNGREREVVDVDGEREGGDE